MRLLRILIYIPVCLLLLAGCGSRMGYFVMIWPDDNSDIENGTVFPVKGESNLRQTYIVDMGNKAYVEIDKFRGQFFKTLKEAQNYGEAFLPYKDMFASVNRKTPVREAADEHSSRIYILREGQIVKIVGRGESKVVIDNRFEGYWYQIVTDDGVSGYCFDRNLSVFDSTDKLVSEYATSNDVNMHNFMNARWYPMAYRETLDSEYPQLNILRSGEVLFADPEKKEIRLRTPEEEIIFRYTSMVQTADNRVSFNGTPLELQFYPDGRIFIRYSYNGLDCSGFYMTLDKDITEYIAEINEQKENEYSELFGRVQSFGSTDYGTITFQPDKKFYWTDYDGISYLIPAESGISGLVDNDKYVSNVIRTRFKCDALLSLTFAKNAREVSFICRKEKNGNLQLIFIPKEDLATGVLTRIPAEPVMLIFSPLKDNE